MIPAFDLRVVPLASGRTRIELAITIAPGLARRLAAALFLLGTHLDRVPS